MSIPTFDMVLPLLLLSLLAAGVPLLLTTFSGYVKVSVALAILRSSFGGPQIPSAAISGVLSMVIAITTMRPVLEQTYVQAEKILSAKMPESISELRSAWHQVSAPWMEYMERQVAAATRQPIASLDGWRMVLQFLILELRRGCELGLLFLIPFLVIDLVVSQVLAALGLTSLSCTIVALPLKLYLLISIDGWQEIVRVLEAG